MLQDERLYPQMREMIGRLRDTDGRPPRPELAGHTREAKTLHEMNVTLTRLLQQQARNFSIQLPLGPMYPAEKLQLEMDQENLADLDEDIYGSMKTTAVQRKRKEA